MISLDDIRIGEVPEHLRARAAAAQQEADISLAGTQLAKLRQQGAKRQTRLFTGRVFGRRGWRGMQVILPNGRIGTLFRARRGAALVSWRDEFALRPDQYAALSTADLKPFKHAAAMLLGAAKRGVRERKSLQKARAARINGAAPPRPGSRPRGRPRTNQSPRVISG